MRIVNDKEYGQQTHQKDGIYAPLQNITDAMLSIPKARKAISDTVHFKHKYITEPTLTPEDTIVKALDDLTQALKERRNKKGTKEIDALQQINELLTNIPTTANTTQHRKSVTFEATTKPPQETQPATPRVAKDTPNPRVATGMSTPKVPDETPPTPRVSTARPNKIKATIDKPILTTEKATNETLNRARLKDLLRVARLNRARIPQRHQMNLRRNTPTERIQLVHNTETGEYLNYRQLMRSPKHKETWSKSAANEFGRLAQGLKDGRVKGTNTIKFIRKNKIPQDRRKDVTYGSVKCEIKTNKAETHRTRLTAGGDRINYPEDVGTLTADMTLFKILANSIILTPGARCIMIDIKDFYLNTPMK
jgi:hypothetical protein